MLIEELAVGLPRRTYRLEKSPTRTTFANAPA
jgi:hypothetical protein